ncbi:MAG: hypothetical protein D6702_09445 [Planctomycetota bacterium]|nr:MAG: hypothetical protein D6702_09445 [Planctomycetota bacterium]
MKTLLVIAVCAAVAALMILAPGALNTAFDGLDLALGWLGPFWVVTLLSAVVGVLFIVAFPHVSWQAGIARFKDRGKYNLLGIRLFQDNIGAVLRHTAGTLGWNLGYLGLNLAPMVFLALPFMAVWFQFNSLYAFAPLQVGDERLVVAQLRDDVDPAEVELVRPEDANWSVAGGPVRIAGDAGQRFLHFTLRADGAGVSEIRYRWRGQEVGKQVAVAEDPGRLTPVRTAHPWRMLAAAKDPILYFGEGVLPADSFVQTIYLEYPPAPLGPFAGGEITIMIIFVVVSMAFGFGLKGYFGVEI